MVSRETTPRRKWKTHEGPTSGHLVLSTAPPCAYSPARMGSTVPEVIARAKRLIAERKHQEAVRACRRVLLARPDEGEVRLLLAQALLAQDRHDEVRLEMLSLLRRAPGNGTAHRLLGEARMRLGRTESAREALREALRVDPSDEEARELLEELGETTELLPPRAETIDRWFADEATVGDLEPLEGEATMATAVPLPEDAFDDSTSADPRVHTGPSVQLAPGLVGDSGPIPAAPAQPAAPAPVRKPARKATLLGMAALASSADAPLSVPSLPSVPGAGPPGGGPPRAAAPSPGRSRPDGTVPFDSSPPSGPASPSPVRPAGLPVPSHPPAPLGSATDELSVDDLSPAELSPAGLPVRRPAAMRPENTGLLEVDDLLEVPEPGAPAFGDETTRGARPASRTPAAPVVAAPPAPDGRGFAEEGSGDGTTEARPRVEGFAFPTDGIDTGLPPLDGEATAAREAPLPEPIAPPARLPAGFAPAATPGGPSLEASATPMPPPSRSIPTERPPAPSVASALTSPAAVPGPGRLDGGRERLAEGWGRLKGRLETKSGTGRIPTPVWLALAGFPVLLLVLLIAGIRALSASGAEEDATVAARAAADDGLLATLSSALAFEDDEELDEPTSRARQGWLFAMAAFEHGRDTEAEAQGRLAQVDPDGLPETATMAGLARSYLALERGAAEEAASALEGLDPALLGGEVPFARARVALARGDLASALDEARKAQSARPNAARYAALLAQAMALQGESDPALQLTSGVAGAEGSPVVRLARVEAHAANDDWDASLAEAEAVIGPLAERASARQIAWAELGAARALAGKGEDVRARDMLAQAVEKRPEAHEAFGLSVAETFLAVGSPQDARTFIDALPEAPADPHRRAAVAAEVYLAQNDLDALERALGEAADSPRTAFLRGRLAEARDQTDDAKRFYEAAAVDEESRAGALVRLGAIALDEERVDDALQRLKSAVEIVPQDGEAVALLAHAHLADGDVAEAGQVLRRGLEALPGDPRLLMARAEVELADDRPEAAMQTLEALVEQRPNDAKLHASLGEAARRMGNLSRAATAYAKALELRPANARALLGQAMVALEAGDAPAARAAVEAAEAGGAGGRQLEVAKARLMVLEGLGREAVQALDDLVGRRSRDAGLLIALGQAQAQAEDYRDAKGSFERALRADEGAIDAHLGMALVETRLGDLRGASQSVGAAERLIRSRELGPLYEARVATARGRIRFEYGGFGDAAEHAREAVEKDPGSAEGHFLLAMIADAKGEDPEAHLRRAAEGRMPAPEVLGQLVIHMSRGRERCEFGRRYLRGAPGGIDAPDVRRATRRCR